MKYAGLPIAFVLLSFLGCAPSAPNKTALVPMPTGTLPATHVSDVLPAAGGRSSYHDLAEVQFSRLFDAEINIITLEKTIN